MKRKAIGGKVHNGFEIIAVGALTGAFAGLTVTCYSALVLLCEEFSVGYYGFFRTHPYFIPLLFLALCVGAVVVGGIVKFVPMIRGSGFPQTEGATQGLFRFKWYKTLTGMFAASLFAIFFGLTAGAEGPGLLIGASCGQGMSDLTRRSSAARRYQITGGACAGLAVVLNAPLTGMVFAYEEAHKRFTPEVFICSFSSVAVAIVIRGLLGPLVGLENGAFFAGFAFPEGVDLLLCLYVLAAAVPTALLGLAFYGLVFAARKFFKKIRIFRGYGNFLIPFLLAGVFGLISEWTMGGGVEFLHALSGSSGHTMSVFGAPLWVSLLLILGMRFVATVVNAGSDLPCCVSVPMMAMGGACGMLVSLLLQKAGMDPAYTDALVVICMVTFFTTVVRAPVTGILMTVELTWNFSFLLPAVIGVAVGYLIGGLFRLEPMYEAIFEEMYEEDRAHAKKITATVRVTKADGRNIRDVLWPYSALVTGITRGEESVTPGGETNLAAGDLLTVDGMPVDQNDFLSEPNSLVGEVVSVTEHAPPAPDPPQDPPENGGGEQAQKP